MTEVYGFDDSKSKVQIVDEESQSTKDAEQDESITGKGISDIVATLDGDNLAVTVKQADGTSKSGSVTLPAGGTEIEVEYFSDGTVIDEANLNRPVTFSSGVTVSTTTTVSDSYHTYINNPTVSADALYYDGTNNVMKRGITQTVGTSVSGYVNVAKRNTVSDSVNTTICNAFSWLKGLKLNADVDYLSFLVDSKIIRFAVTLSTGNVISAIEVWFVFSTTSTTTWKITSGTYDVQWVNTMSTNDTAFPILSDSNTLPSTYTKIIDL